MANGLMVKKLTKFDFFLFDRKQIYKKVFVAKCNILQIQKNKHSNNLHSKVAHDLQRL